MADFDDWEMLQPEMEEHEEEVYGVGADVEAEGLLILRPDYFSIDSGIDDSNEVSIEGLSVESDGPCWIDADECDAVVFQWRDSGEFWSDSGSDRSKMTDYSGEKIGLGFVQSGDDDRLFEVENRRGCVGKFGYETEGVSSGAAEFEVIDEVEKTTVVFDESAEKVDMADFPREEFANGIEMGIRDEEGCVEAVEDGKIGKEAAIPSELERKTVIWWKVPIELVKFCVLRVSPLRFISVVAAMVGVFIMRKILQNKKRKSKGLQMTVVDHKKVDQFMNRVARLNEAFSVVNRVPIMRLPYLPRELPLGLL